MPEFSKKRRFGTSDDSDVGTSHKVAKKSKSKPSAAPAGRDDEGNPYWEVRNAYVVTLLRECAHNHYFLAAFQQTSCRSIPVQKHVFDKYPRIL